MERTEQLRMREMHLQLPLTDAAVRALELGDAVFLTGMIFTGREGFYQQVFEKGVEPPLDLRHSCNVTFHCSPAVNEPRHRQGWHARRRLPDRLSPARRHLFDHRRLWPGSHLRAGHSPRERCRLEGRTRPSTGCV